MEWEKEDLRVLCLFLGSLDDLGILETDERDTAWSCDRMHKCGGRGRSRGRTALSEKELARGGTLPSFACMDGNLKFMWKGMRSQLKGSVGVWAVV